MKFLALLAVLLPAPMGVERPDYICHDDGWCLVQKQVLQEIIHHQHERCERVL